MADVPVWPAGPALAVAELVADVRPEPDAFFTPFGESVPVP
jgi:hypothetical protein